MGVVYAALDRERGVEVALKVLQRVDADGIAQIKREFRSLAEVSHPNLVTLYELVSAGEIWFFTMELVDGVDFRSWVWRGEAPPGGIDSPAPITVRWGPTRPPVATLKQVGTPDAPTTPQPGAPPPGAPPDNDRASDPAPAPEPAAGSPVAGPPAAGPPAVDLDRLRSGLRQLASGVRSVHGAGKLHRDIKPTNALVTAEGRVVLLDFGLVRPRAPGDRGDAAPDAANMAGTPEYMAPEQLMGQLPTPASDWYALGVLLYEALLGRLPFEGSFATLFLRKTTTDPPDPRPFVAPEARDLADLALHLLARDPQHRPPPEALLRALGASDAPLLIASSMSAEDERPFVGREPQLAELRAAFRDRLDRGPVVVTLRGRSGIGKSALSRRFIDEVRAGGGAGDARPLVLHGRCYERESVPYKALDGLMDGLSDELGGWSKAERDGVLPAETEARDALASVFPVLRQLWGAPETDRTPTQPLVEPRTLRRRAVAALCGLLRRLAERRALVLHIDDLQWGDADSADVLAELLTDQGPRALWVLSYRAEDEDRSELLVALGKIFASRGREVDVRRIDLEPLSLESCRALVLRLFDHVDPETRRRAEALAREAAGSPLFVHELVRFEREEGAGAAAASGAQPPSQPTTLEQLLRARVSSLPPAARRLLARVAVAGRPMRQGLLWRAAGLGADDTGAFLTLRNANLMRATGVKDQDTVEAYHDRVRELVVATLDPEEARQSHAALAAALQAQGEAEQMSPADLEAVAYHARGAGDAATACRFGLLAARQASAVYASRDAVRHFEVTLALMTGPLAAGRQEVEMEAAEACRQAGLYERALALLAGALGVEAPGSDDRHRAELFVRRGRVYQEKGDTRAAVADLEAALLLFGRPAPRGAAGLLAAAAGEMARYAGGALFGRRGREGDGGAGGGDGREAAVDRQADVLFVLMRIYYFVDIGKLVWAGFAAMNLARRSRRILTRALAGGYFGALLLGVGWRERAARHCERALALAAQSSSRLAEGVALGRLGILAVFANQLERAREVLARSAAALSGVSETWELLTSLMLAATAEFLAGRLELAEKLWDQMAVVARDVGGAMHSAWCLSWAPYVRYLRGLSSAGEAKLLLAQAVELSRSVGDIANQAAAQSHLAAISVAERDRAGAARAALRLYETLARYRVQVPFLQVGLVDAAEAALLALQDDAEGARHPRRRRALEMVVRRSLRRLARLARSYPHLRAPALRVAALAAARQGHAAQARALIGKAVELLEASPNRLWLLAAYRSAAELLPERGAEFADHVRRLTTELDLRVTPASSSAPSP